MVLLFGLVHVYEQLYTPWLPRTMVLILSTPPCISLYNWPLLGIGIHLTLMEISPAGAHSSTTDPPTIPVTLIELFWKYMFPVLAKIHTNRYQ